MTKQTIQALARLDVPALDVPAHDVPASPARRRLLTGMAACAAFSALPLRAEASYTGVPPRSLAFVNTHTGESLKVTYWEKGSYLTDALAEINHVLRDHRNDKVHAMDPELLDQLAEMRRTLRVTEPFQVISGYRSPESNELLHRNSGGVAKSSLHMQGRAIDIRLHNRTTKEIQSAALLMKRGGVGYYPKSDFVHLDSGRVRSWGGA